MLFVILLSTFVAIFPREYSYNGQVAATFKQLRVYLFEGPVDQVTGLQSSLFSNRLVLPGKDFASLAGQNSARAQPSVSLRGRWLEGAILTRSNLQLADFTGARLQGADLSHANVNQGKFGCGQVDRIGSYADPEEQTADCANLNEANLSFANLQGAFFNDAAMQGTDLSDAKLQAASLERADLKGAYLSSSDLRGASLAEVQFQGASISDVDFRGAGLNLAIFQGADLRKSDFRGAILIGTNFLGVVPDIDTKWKGAILDPNLGERGSINSAQFNDFVESTLDSISARKTKEQIQERLKQFEPIYFFSEDQYRMKWKQIKGDTLPAVREVWDEQWLNPMWQGRIDFVIDMVCSKEQAPVMANSLILQSVFPDEGGLEVRFLEGTGPFRPALAQQMLNTDKCPGTLGIKPEAQEILRQWADEKLECELPLPLGQPIMSGLAADGCFQKSRVSDR